LAKNLVVFRYPQRDVAASRGIALLTQNQYWDHITGLSGVSNIVQRLRIIDDSTLHTQHHVTYPHPGFLRNALDGDHFGTTIHIKLIATIGGQIANGNAQSRLLTRTTRPSAGRSLGVFR
jgi:hypothetical protein